MRYVICLEPDRAPADEKAFAEALDEADLHPWAENMESFLAEHAGALTPNCRYAANRFDVLPTDWYLRAAMLL